MRTISTDGWTQVAPSADSRIIYVSSSVGNDANSGTSSAPVRSLGKAASLTRSGMPDHILLKRGDTWTWPLILSTSGRSGDEPLLIGSYGSGPRPILKTGTTPALQTGAPIAHVVVTDLQLVGPGNGQDVNGFEFMDRVSGLLMENIRVTGFGFGGVIQPLSGRSADITIRRCVIHENWKPGMSQGVYIEGVDRLTLIENLFDYNGWREGMKAPTKFDHNVYVQDDPTDGSQPVRQLVVRNNISLRSAAQGMKLQPRDSSIIVGNLCAYCGIGIGSGQTGGEFSDNVVTEGIYRAEAMPGIGVIGAFAATLMRGNIAVNVATPGQGYPVAYDISGQPSTWADNVEWRWTRDASDGRKANRTSGFPEPERCLTVFGRCMGFAEIITPLHTQERGAWDSRLTAQTINAWIAAGFGLADDPPPPPPPPPPVEVNIDSLVVRRTDGTTQTFKPYKPPAKSAAIKQINVIYSDGTIAEPFKAA